jgi:ribosomal protein S15P/S13E
MANHKDELSITIVGWEKYNKVRSDVKHSSWFRMEHSIAVDPEWDTFDGEEKWVWTFLLSMSSLKNRSTIQLSAETIADRAKVAIAKVLSAIQKLKDRGCVKIARRPRTGHVSRAIRTSIATDGRTDGHNGRTDDTGDDDESDPPDLDFRALYQKYPRKVQPSEAIKRCAQVIRTPEDHALLSKAIDRYTEHIREHRTEQRFIMHMATFVEKRESKPYIQPWRDWLDPETGTAIDTGAGTGIDIDKALKMVGHA